jgi:glycerophosphoryl diester phosphodiesterase
MVSVFRPSKSSIASQNRDARSIRLDVRRELRARPRRGQTVGPLTLSALVLATLGAGSAGGVESTGLDVQGHRGCRGLLPENTLPAFERALQLEVTTLELDVQATRDRVLVVHHDPRLNPKLCVRDDGSKLSATPFEKLDYADLSDIDCGKLRNSKFPEQQPAPGARIPTLNEILQLAEEASYSVRVSIEIKMQKQRPDLGAKELAALVLEAVDKHDLQSRTIIQSFDAEALVAVRELAPEMPRAYLVRDRKYQTRIDDGTVTIVSPKHVSLREADVVRLHEQGIAVIPWTVNDPQAIRRMISWNVDGIISDYPNRVIEARDELAE